MPSQITLFSVFIAVIAIMTTQDFPFIAVPTPEHTKLGRSSLITELSPVTTGTTMWINRAVAVTSDASTFLSTTPAVVICTFLHTSTTKDCSLVLYQMRME